MVADQILAFEFDGDLGADILQLGESGSASVMGIPELEVRGTRGARTTIAARILLILDPVI
jgi:hypothetical protein